MKGGVSSSSSYEHVLDTIHQSTDDRRREGSGYENGKQFE